MIILLFVILSLLSFDALGMKRKREYETENTRLALIQSTTNTKENNVSAVCSFNTLPHVLVGLIVGQASDSESKTRSISQQRADLSQVNTLFYKVFNDPFAKSYFKHRNNILVNKCQKYYNNSRGGVDISNISLFCKETLHNPSFTQPSSNSSSTSYPTQLLHLLKIIPYPTETLWVFNKNGYNALYYALQTQDNNILDYYKNYGNVTKNSLVQKRTFPQGGFITITLAQFLGSNSQKDWSKNAQELFNITQNDIETSSPARRIRGNNIINNQNIPQNHNQPPVRRKLNF